MAIESFFEGGNDDDLPIGEPQGPASKPTRPTAPVNLNDESDDDDDDDDDYRPSRGGMLGGKGNPFSGLKPQEPNKTKKPSGNSRFATISSMNKDEDMDEDEDEEKGQAFYAGGSQTSGQQILGPPKKNAEKIIKNLFEKAKE
jgi:UBX domain-containing protein 1